MLGVTDLPTYLVGLALIILLPGPNSLYVLSVAARRGVRRGYAAAGGVFCGDAVLMLLSAAGVASLLQANAVLYSIVKYAGAGYLTWLAVGMLRAAAGMWRKRQERPARDAAVPAARAVPGAGGSAGAPRSVAGERPFRRALGISLLNPKAILFFVSFFVQFVDPGYAHPALSFLLLGAFCQLFSFLYLTALILGGSRLAERFRRRRRLAAGVTSAAGALFLGFAVKLSLSSAAG
ncbi:leucine efflux protein LeuE [Streptomyces albus]|uniref:leucine efflux protein LeuE n=1 Tax=Streptomyces albus TaxID=1888 RepID=UPI0004C9982F|nr:leucine efflux protein LeuE [Streptomyces albus]